MDVMRWSRLVFGNALDQIETKQHQQGRPDVDRQVAPAGCGRASDCAVESPGSAVDGQRKGINDRLDIAVVVCDAFFVTDPGNANSSPM